VPEAAEVRLLGGSVGFAAALHKGASTRSQQKRVRKPIDRCLLNMGDQDWIDRVLRDEKPSTQRLVGRRNRAHNEAWMAECKRLEGARDARMREMLAAMDNGE
jgi:hypothetical protein